jgi:hypothetical protein
LRILDLNLGNVLNSIMIKHLYAMLIMFRKRFKQMLIELVNYEVFWQKWIFMLMHPHASLATWTVPSLGQISLKNLFWSQWWWSHVQIIHQF